MTASGLFTDFYELTMAQGFHRQGMNGNTAFEMFFRRQPFDGGYAVFAGLEPFLDALAALRFPPDEIDWLASLELFDRDFLDRLAAFRFSGTVWAQDEGSAIFPQVPLVRIEAPLVEAQLIEGLLLNTVNFQSLIATKAARICQATRGASVMEFGLRRAQGHDGALAASRAAYIGGAAGTSNTLAGKTWGIPVMGTMAHSWVMSFPDELSAFRAYAERWPGNSVFLIDTYDTLKSGIVNAITVGKELKAKGQRIGVRLDSGDIHYLSVQVRKALDEAGLEDARIAVSNDLDETIIDALVSQGAPIDNWGVGTHMVTGGGDSSFTGVYKLAARQGSDGAWQPVMKFSDNPEKTTNPGVKQAWRLYDANGLALADYLALEDEGEPVPGPEGDLRLWHPASDYRHIHLSPPWRAEPLLKKRMENGRLLAAHPGLDEIRKHREQDLASLDPSYRRLLNPHRYKVSVSSALRSLKLSLIERFLG